MDTNVKSSGTVKFYDTTKGFGFINDDDGEDVFVHVSEVASAKLVALNRGERLRYTAVKTNRGRKALNLERTAA
jgi:cold shock protein